MKLGLGTAQFGLDYGVANKEGKTPPEEVIKILEVAAQNGVQVIDTGSLYGTSEDALGEALPHDHGFSIVTKTPQFKKDYITLQDATLLEDTFYQSLSKMHQVSSYGLLIYNADDLLAKNGYLLMERLQNLKQRGLIEKIGVSVYTGDQIDGVLGKFQVDIVQLPINVFDQRLIQSGHLLKLNKLGIEVHARSVFLQGLLIMDPYSLPLYFDSAREHLVKYHEALQRQGVSAVQAALDFMAGLSEVDIVICGVNDHLQLLEICSRYKSAAAKDFAEFATKDVAIVDPSKWRISG